MTIIPKLAGDLRLGDRISVPGTSITSSVRFIHNNGKATLVEFDNGDKRVWANDVELRVVA